MLLFLEQLLSEKLGLLSVRNLLCSCDVSQLEKSDLFYHLV